MIGIYAILMDVALGAFGLGLLARPIWGLIKVHRRTKTVHQSDLDRTRVPQVMLILAIMWLAFVASRTLPEVRFHSDLSLLRADTIGSKSVTTA
jgi:hypothetical protein